MIGVGMGSVTESGGTLESDVVDVRTLDTRAKNQTQNAHSNIQIESDFAVSVDSETKKLKGPTPRDYAAIAFFSWLILATFSCAQLFRLDTISSLYFVTVTFTSVGYGDIVPSTDGEKLFMTGFVLVSIVVIGLAFGLLFAYVFFYWISYSRLFNKIEPQVSHRS